MRGEVPLRDRPTKRKRKEGLFFPRALVYHGLVIISSRFRSQAPTCNTVAHHACRDNAFPGLMPIIVHHRFRFTNIFKVRNNFDKDKEKICINTYKIIFSLLEFLILL